MEEECVSNGDDLFNLFFDSNYVEQVLGLPSGREMRFLALKTARTDPDLTGQILWPGCVLLLHWLDRNLDRFRDRSVVELGAGTAVCSLFLALNSDPRVVVATDGSPHVLELIERNIELHKKSEIVKAVRLQWRGHDCGERFDFVIGSEIAYDENCIGALVETVGALLCENGCFVIGHIDRYAQTTRALMERLEGSGFVKEEEIGWDELMSYQMELIVGSVMVWRRATVACR
jgi:predicted nicotinamide N-methyase